MGNETMLRLKPSNRLLGADTQQQQAATRLVLRAEQRQRYASE